MLIDARIKYSSISIHMFYQVDLCSQRSIRSGQVCMSTQSMDPESHLQTLVIYKVGFNQNNYTFTSILLIEIVLCRTFSWAKFINHKCFHMNQEQAASAGPGGVHWLHPRRRHVRGCRQNARAESLQRYSPILFTGCNRIAVITMSWNQVSKLAPSERASRTRLSTKCLSRLASAVQHRSIHA